MDKKWIGRFARALHSIAVERPQDLMIKGKGRIYIDPSNNFSLRGIDTSFTTQITSQCTISLNSNVSFSIERVVSDTQIILKTVPEDAIEYLEFDETKPKEQQGSQYKIIPFIDQSQMFEKVTERLLQGRCIGIFPEGGSHDRPEFLPMKAGFSIMAFQAMSKNPQLNLKIVPVGLHYFHPGAVIEFGDPIPVSMDLVEAFNRGGSDKRDACASLIDMTCQSLTSITVTAPDYDTLMVLQAARRLYKPENIKLELTSVLEITRHLRIGYERFGNEPKIKQLKDRVMEYNKMLRTYGIRDHQIKNMTLGGKRAWTLLASRLALLSIICLMIVPGLIVNLPMAILAKFISERKAAEALKASSVKIKGQVGTWKIIIAMLVIPPLYILYTLMLASFLYLYRGLNFMLTLIISLIFLILFLPILSLKTLQTMERGIDIVKSIPPLIHAILPGSNKEKLLQTRNSLQKTLVEVVDEYGPRTFDDFEKIKVVRDRWWENTNDSFQEDDLYGDFNFKKDD